MSNTPTTDRIMKWIMNGYNPNQWFEDNKKEFIRKNNPQYYETLYGKENNNNNKEDTIIS